MSWRKELIPEDSLYGIRYWKYVFQDVPYLEVYRYIGRSKSGNIFYFDPVKKKGNTLAVFKSELNSKKFNPFLLSLDDIEAWYQAESDKNDQRSN